MIPQHARSKIARLPCASTNSSPVRWRMNVERQRANKTEAQEPEDTAERKEKGSTTGSLKKVTPKTKT